MVLIRTREGAALAALLLHAKGEAIASLLLPHQSGSELTAQQAAAPRPQRAHEAAPAARSLVARSGSADATAPREIPQPRNGCAVTHAWPGSERRGRSGPWQTLLEPVAREQIAVVVGDVAVAGRPKQRECPRLSSAGVESHEGIPRFAGEVLEPPKDEPGDRALANLRHDIEPLDLRAVIVEPLDTAAAHRTPVGVSDDERARRRHELVGLGTRPHTGMPAGVERADLRRERADSWQPHRRTPRHGARHP